MPAIRVDKSTSPSSRPEPGGSYDIIVTIDNDSTVDALTITSIIDDPHGDLDGQGDCSVPQTIPPGGSYSCSVPEELIGNAGDSESDAVTVVGNDNEGNVVSDDDGATFTITDLVPVLDVDRPPRHPVPEPGRRRHLHHHHRQHLSRAGHAADHRGRRLRRPRRAGRVRHQPSCSHPLAQTGDTYACAFTVYVGNNAGERRSTSSRSPAGTTRATSSKAAIRDG